MWTRPNLNILFHWVTFICLNEAKLELTIDKKHIEFVTSFILNVALKL